jgi:hypothetical protein
VAGKRIAADVEIGVTPLQICCGCATAAGEERFGINPIRPRSGRPAGQAGDLPVAPTRVFISFA